MLRHCMFELLISLNASTPSALPLRAQNDSPFYVPPILVNFGQRHHLGTITVGIPILRVPILGLIP